MAETKPALAGCPRCGATDQIQRSNNVHVWERGTLDENGDFEVDDFADVEFDWESQNPDNLFFCLNPDCGCLFRLGGEHGVTPVPDETPDQGTSD
jgi:hypothetical protein